VWRRSSRMGGGLSEIMKTSKRQKLKTLKIIDVAVSSLSSAVVHSSSKQDSIKCHSIIVFDSGILN